MRALLTCLIIGCAGSAHAMNWEGHDDWMASAGPALAYEHAAPHALIVPDGRATCPDAADTAAQAVTDNPYEQIPLERHECRTPGSTAEPKR